MHTCSKCNEIIKPPSPVSAYENKFYHPDCLTCNTCHKSLSGRQFIKEKNGHLTCEECNAKYAPKCNRCKQTFATGTSYKKINENLHFHNECFKCSGPCHQPISSEFYDIENGKFLCVDCYDKYGNDYEKYIKDDEDDFANRPPPPVPKTEPPQPRGSGVDRLSNRFESNLNIKPTNNNNNNNNSSIETLPAVQRDREAERNRFTNNVSPAKQDTPPKRDNPPKQDDSELNCAKCNQKLVGTYTVYNEKKYHTKCFVCIQCNEEFKEKSFFKLDGNPLCRNCHSKNLVSSASKCRKCSQPILDTIVTFKGGEFHDYCLVCTLCSKKLVGQSIYTDKVDKPYCVGCFTKKEGKYCGKCAKIIAPSQPNLIFEEKHFHKECFTCSKCSRQINSTESFYKGDKGENDVICAACVDQ